MGVRILYDADSDMAALYCSTSDVAFGPVFYRSDETPLDAQERADAFLKFLPQDARRYSEQELMALYHTWTAQEPALWAASEDASDEQYVADICLLRGIPFDVLNDHALLPQRIEAITEAYPSNLTGGRMNDLEELRKVAQRVRTRAATVARHAGR